MVRAGSTPRARRLFRANPRTEGGVAMPGMAITGMSPILADPCMARHR
jgi:hypothetical protein